RNQHGTKNFLPDNGGILAAVDEYSGFDKITLVTFAIAAGQYFTAFGTTFFDIAHHPVLLYSRHQGADHGFRVAAMTDLERLGSGNHRIHHLIKDFFLHIKS